MRIVRIWMSSSALKTVLDAAASKERSEPCGALLGFRVPLGAEVVEAVRLKNSHPSSQRAFLLEPASILEAGRAARGKGLDIVGFWHGHLEGPAWPGVLDEDGMRATQVEGAAPMVHVVVGRGCTGKRVVRGFRPGRAHAKQVPIEQLRRPRGSASTAGAPALS